MDNEINVTFERANRIVTDIMKEIADMDENTFLATISLLIKVYSIEKEADIGELVSKLFIGIARTEGSLHRMMIDDD